MAFATTAAIAGASAAAAYLDARLHITKDLATIREQKKVAKLAQERGKDNKRSLWYDFEQQVLQRGNAPCMWYRDTTGAPARFTWTQAYDNVNRYAQFLLDNDIGPGQLVATYLINSPHFMFAMMGSWACGSAPALINHHLAGEGLIHCLKVANSKVLLVDEDSACQQRIEEVRPQIESLGMRVIVLDTVTREAILQRKAERLDDGLRDHVKGEDPIFLFYTSGTTGLPKACALQTQRSYVLGFPRLRSTGLKPGDVWYDCMPMYHGTGCTVAVGCMITGLTLAIGQKFSVRNFWRDIHDSGAHAFAYVGESARYLLAAPPSSLDKGHNLRAMFGNGLRPDIWAHFQERFDVPVVNEFFNSTEGMLSLLNVCRGPFHIGSVGHHGAILRSRYHNVFIPVEIDYESGDRIWRDPKTGFARRKSYAEGGEIIVACNSESDFGGYWGNPEATESRFERNVFRKGDLYYRTGDALRRDQDGRWYFLDRLGDSFRWKAENVSTAQVAEVLGRFPGIVEANVYGVELPNHDGRAGCAAVFIRQEERVNFDYAGLLAHARKGLPRYAVPVFLRIIEQDTPQGMHNNKQNKVPLRKEGVDPSKIADGIAGRNDNIVWSQPGVDRYVPFGQHHWDSLTNGKLRL